jgi:hypothetical protein
MEKCPTSAIHHGAGVTNVISKTLFLKGFQRMRTRKEVAGSEISSLLQNSTIRTLLRNPND